MGDMEIQVMGHVEIQVHEPCIYRVPSQIRDVKPEAYTPKMVVIGPLHRSPKPSTAEDGAETSSSYPWHLKKEYVRMEEKKKTYLKYYTQRVGEDTIEEMRKTIQAEENNIRASYKESTEWISSEYFVELILEDSVFIMEFFLKDRVEPYKYLDKTVNESLNNGKVFLDLMLLENQLPYFILDRLFSTSMNAFIGDKTLDQFIVESLRISIAEKTNFKHFTDIYRCVYEESFDDVGNQMLKDPERCIHLSRQPISELRNADYLSQAGVTFRSSNVFDRQEFKGRKYLLISSFISELIQQQERLERFSLQVTFKKGCLTMPIFHVDETYDMYLRNVIAYEQCHVAVKPLTSNYIHFLNFLITSDRDVQLLTEEGVVRNITGRPRLVMDMVNKLQAGLRLGDYSQYYYIAMKLKAHYKSRRKMCWATLNKVYFSDMLTGTATLGAVLLLFLTLVGTIASVLQAYKSLE
ncbi:hypothetical protein CARUB_v10020252mg [Capsella rubella]|uniref:Uncharacterized protein n=1 Tax=Capsella rubella TaxID=81985 RepID=R0IEI2_9BRAS|nr:putative UPF0481 protein At3g02645 [Capsella rubella]XP_006302231.1 putative UPF0481 protein At3g02645 [Capsella rubella]EOA35128.1 hypothetical protein CARUB_v10020252mg [Capsella rubella]EOA35129.1 hypothetical protein CARUB_v10020252mg [Capsella rubella]